MDVKIKIKTSQVLEDGNIQTIESFYKGKKIIKKTGVFLDFAEPGGRGENHSTIKVSDDEVMIIKSGEAKSKMKFVENEEYKSIYSTPYGNFDLSIYTFKITKKILDEEMKLNLDYKIEVKGLMKSNNRIEIKAVMEA